MKPPRKAQIPLEKCNRLINHGPCSLLTTNDGNKDNVATIAWLMPCGKTPPMIAVTVGASSYTNEVLRQTGEFVVNIPGPDLIEDLVRCGSSSGKEIDKFKEYWLTSRRGVHVKAPWVAEAMAHLECILTPNYKPTADEYNIFVGEVIGAFADTRSFANGKWRVEEQKAPTVHHLGGESFVIPGKVINCRLSLK